MITIHLVKDLDGQLRKAQELDAYIIHRMEQLVILIIRSIWAWGLEMRN